MPEGKQRLKRMGRISYVVGSQIAWNGWHELLSECSSELVDQLSVKVSGTFETEHRTNVISTCARGAYTMPSKCSG